MLNDQQRALINALSDEELEYEIARGSASRFQREKYDYLNVVRSQRLQANIRAEQATALKVAQDSVAATRSSTKWATVGWIIASAIAVAGIVVAAIFSR